MPPDRRKRPRFRTRAKGVNLLKSADITDSVNLLFRLHDPPARRSGRAAPEGLFGPTRLACERTCPSPGRRSRGTVGPRISALDEIRMRPPPEGGRIRVRGEATPGFGPGRDCRTPLRLRARALQRTARPRQCLGLSGRGLAGQVAGFVGGGSWKQQGRCGSGPRSGWGRAGYGVAAGGRAPKKS